MICLRLPFPVSVNAMYRSNRGKVHKSAVYMRWIGAANSAYLMQKREAGSPIKGPFSAAIALDRNRKGRSDLDNFVKSILDRAQAFGLIENDKLAEEISVRWETMPPDTGCLLYLFKAGEPAPVNAEERAA